MDAEAENPEGMRASLRTTTTAGAPHRGTVLRLQSICRSQDLSPARHLGYGACSGKDCASLPGGFHARLQPASHLYAPRGSIAHRVGCRRVRVTVNHGPRQPIWLSGCARRRCQSCDFNTRAWTELLLRPTPLRTEGRAPSAPVRCVPGATKVVTNASRLLRRKDFAFDASSASGILPGSEWF